MSVGTTSTTAPVLITTSSSSTTRMPVVTSSTTAPQKTQTTSTATTSTTTPSIVSTTSVIKTPYIVQVRLSVILSASQVSILQAALRTFFNMSSNDVHVIVPTSQGTTRRRLLQIYQYVDVEFWFYTATDAQRMQNMLDRDPDLTAFNAWIIANNINLPRITVYQTPTTTTVLSNVDLPTKTDTVTSTSSYIGTIIGAVTGGIMVVIITIIIIVFYCKKKSKIIAARITLPQSDQSTSSKTKR